MKRCLAIAIAFAALLSMPPGAAAKRHCRGANLLPSAHNLRRVKAATLCLVNRERARHGERPLRASRRLMRVSRAHSDDMVARDYFSHIAPGGQTPLDRIRASGFISRSRSWSIAENIGWGTLWLATPREIVRAWMLSPGHRAAILARDYRLTGIGVAPAVPGSLAKGQAGAVYTQDFAALSS